MSAIGGAGRARGGVPDTGSADANDVDLARKAILESAAGSGRAARGDTSGPVGKLARDLAKDGVFDAADAQALLAEAEDHGAISKGERDEIVKLLRDHGPKVTPAALEVIARRFDVSLRRPSAPTAAPGSADDVRSYAELAAATVAPLADDVVRGLSKIDASTPPHDVDLKAYRKQAQKLRDHLDLFAFAYGRGPQEKEWDKLRKLLDEGYERIGAFKDLFDSQGLTLATQDPATGKWSAGVKPQDVKYDASEVKAARKALLEWRDDMARAGTAARALAGSPSDPPAHVDHDRLSRFFWADVGIEPEGDLTGVGNLRRLASGLLDLAGDGLEGLGKEKRLTDHPEDEAAFHDVRKRLRSIGNLVTSFPGVARDPAAAKAAQAVLTDFVARYGAIEDRLVAWHQAQDRGQNKKADKIAADVEKEWKKLRLDQRAGGLDVAIATLRSALIA